MNKFIVCLASWCLLYTIPVAAQVQTPKYVSMIPHSNAYYEYLPQGYPEPNKKYPLLIFFHGLGEVAQGTPATLPYLLNNGPCKEINNGTFPTSFTVNGQNFKFIVITPQFTEWPSIADADNVINYLISQYPIDINRIYITGLSMGGGVVWTYAGSNATNANRVAAIVPVCGAAWPDQGRATVIAAANLPVWATHNNTDPTAPVFYTENFVGMINAAPVAPNPLAKKTIFQLAYPSHDAWTTTYDPNFKENGINIYEWMLQYQRNLAVLPVSGLEFTATVSAADKVLISWKTVSEINSAGFDVQRSANGITFNNIHSTVSKSINGGGANYSYADMSPLPGVNYYRLQLKDADGKVNYSNIQNVEIKNKGVSITVYPNPATDVINITSQHGFIIKTVQIRNVSGHLVHSEKLDRPGTATINISALPGGVYYGTIIENNETHLFRFVKK